jgi:colicin import membrane protein
MATNTKTLEAILNEVTLLRKEVAEMMAQKPSKAPAKKAAKEVDPDAPKKAPNAWILFTGRVRAALKGAGLPAGKEAQQYASYLKNTYPEAYSMGDEAILEHHSEWTPPEPKPKEAKEEAEEKPKEKPKRVLSEDHKAKMAAGRKAAAERRKAEAAAKEAEAALKALMGDEEAESPATGGGGAAAAAAAPKAAVVLTAVAKAPPKPPTTLTTLPFKGKKLLWDKETGACWENKDGAKGAWMGVLEGTGKERVLKMVPEPEEE